MAKLSRADLKLFFETGDKPTQAQFADLIDSLLSLIDDSNLADLIKIKSATDGKIEVIFSDSFWQLTTDGGVFSESFIFIDPTLISIGSGTTALDLDKNGNAQIGTPLDKLIRFNPGGSVMISLERKSSGLRIIILDLETFADNASAVAGGLLPANVYKTATGELRIVV